jgi:serine/threonine-protein kinase
LGWRPSVGLKIPHLEQWEIAKKIGEGGFGEAWLARNAETKAERVFKFCSDAEILR